MPGRLANTTANVARRGAGGPALVYKPSRRGTVQRGPNVREKRGNTPARQPRGFIGAAHRFGQGPREKRGKPGDRKSQEPGKPATEGLGSCCRDHSTGFARTWRGARFRGVTDFSPFCACTDLTPGSAGTVHRPKPAGVVPPVPTALKFARNGRLTQGRRCRAS